ncbi:MAG TPA: 23S rRNA (adenine(2503)-C(2))-methyltransferase RlmN [Planctomycetaceae bacterium]|nr:23S rRNA (adenine(2503)-C(2))-methyltransferase RlmN [Planctomycetaceae bacterium]
MSNASPSELPLITDLSRAELAEWCQGQGEQPFRAEQIRRWIFGKRVNDFESMHDLPKSLRVAMAAEFRLFASEIAKHQVASDKTEKLVLRLTDGNHIEAVLMREPDRVTVCLSTQVGCAMGCVFCASGLLGVKRNLSTGEIIEQVLRLDRLLTPLERITNVVVMGIGEPLANLKNLLPAMETLNEKGGLGLGARRITISTVGLPDKIGELARYGKPFNLAVSLHAPDDELRNRLVPINEKTGMQAILEAADDYFRETGRRVTFEYVLLGGVNDGIEQARSLARLLEGRGAHVNLIPMNAVNELEFAAPTRARVDAFIDTLTSAGIAATVRKRKGADIDAACGQLRLAAERDAAAPAQVR